jgi:diketogulonate reductase-like aldo/keto reductase
MSIPEFTLANGVKVPSIGLGMDQVRDEAEAYNAVISAVFAGYRSIDTAFSYKNEEYIGRAIKECGVPREELYITTKLTATDQGYEPTLKAFDRSVKNLGVDYLDCFLIHWPGKYLYVDSWKAFEKLYEEKLIRVIGVCNFNRHHIETLEQSASVLPMVNQIESHPYYPQDELQKYCNSKNILMEAWSPLMCGGLVLEDPVIAGISKETGKSPAQVVLRWHHQKNHRIFPKSVTPARIRENFDIFDFSLTKEQMAAINSLGKKNLRIGPNPDIFFMV